MPGPTFLPDEALMKTRVSAPVALLVLLAAPLQGQSTPSGSAVNVHASIGAGSSRLTASPGAVQQWGLLASNRLRLGLGLRYSYFNGKELRYTTADRDQLQGAGVERVFLEAPETHSLNAVFAASYLVTNRVEVGFNIDLLGLSAGGDRVATVQSPGSGVVMVHPTSFNLLLGGRRDRGTLNSEFYGGIWATPRVLVRIGLSHFVSEYSTDQALPNGSDRFRNTGNLVFGAVTYAWRVGG